MPSHHLAAAPRCRGAQPLAAACLALAALGGAPALAASTTVTVTVTNLAPAGGVAFAPLHLGFNQGLFDAFDLGSAAGAAIVSVAEGGSGSAWQPAFAAADPGATRGTVGGLLLAGASASASFSVDSALNPFFTFGAMAVPSNDFFIGNDSPTEYRVLGAGGLLLLPTITLKARDIWDAGSEVFDPAAAAFVGNNSLRAPQHSVVALNFGEFAGYNGLTTGAGYVFNSQLAADSDVYRISFAVAAVPEPSTWALLAGGLLLLGRLARRRTAPA